MSVTVSGSNITFNDGTVQDTKAGITLGPSVDTTSGTAFDFTSIPSTAKRISLRLNGVSTSGNTNPLLQAGSGTIQTTGYSSPPGSSGTITTGFVFTQSAHSNTYFYTGRYVLEKFSGNTWIFYGQGFISGGGSTTISISGIVTLSGALDRVRLTTVNGTDTFDAGSVNISWE